MQKQKQFASFMAAIIADKMEEEVNRRGKEGEKVKGEKEKSSELEGKYEKTTKTDDKI